MLKANAALARSLTPVSQRGLDTMRIERAGNTALIAAMEPTFEFRFWQDGTLSDVGARPIGETADAWMPLQLKHCTTDPPKWSGVSTRYHMSILLTREGMGGAYVLSKNLLAKVGDKLPPRGVLKLTSRWRRTWRTWPQVVEWLAEKWAEGSDRRTERELRAQVNGSSYVEYLHIDLSRRFEPEIAWQWPTATMQVYDQLRNGQTTQFKSVRKDTSGFEASNLHKKIGGQCVPYEIGDNAWYYLCHIDWEHRLFIQWRIPEVAMLQMGLLSVRNNVTNTYTSVGLKQLRLQIVGSTGFNRQLQLTLFGKMPRSDVCLQTSRYCIVHSLPVEMEQRV